MEETTFEGELKETLSSALPTVSEEVQQLVIDKLINSGVESKDDLKYVRMEDIEDVLTVVQQRKLLDAFKLVSETETVTLDLQFLPSSTSSGNEDTNKSWPESFQVPWDLMPVEIRSAISDGNRPSPAARRKMVRVLADEMRKHEPNPTRSQCLTVCRNIAQQYPNSFADQLENGQLLDSGYTSLLIQVKNRIENLNRTSSIRPHRSSGHGQKRGPTDMYGCSRFQPSLPPDETEDTVESKRQKLEAIYSRDGINGAERAEVKQLMEKTFYLQRCHLNVLPAPNIEDIRSKWPFLLTQEGLSSHFELLTDIPLLHTLELAMTDCGRTIVEFFKTKPTNAGVKEILCQDEDAELSFFVTQLLMAHFSEDISGLVLLASASATAADIERTISIPATPRLILLGEPAGSCIQRWMVSLEGRVICEGIQSTFLTGLAALFSTFYIFNLRYQEEASCTLEFIQRRFIGINPERGTKVARAKVLSKKTGKATSKKLTAFNPHVSTLLRRLMDFQWDFI